MLQVLPWRVERDTEGCLHLERRTDATVSRIGRKETPQHGGDRSLTCAAAGEISIVAHPTPAAGTAKLFKRLRRLCVP